MSPFAASRGFPNSGMLRLLVGWIAVAVAAPSAFSQDAQPFDYEVKTLSNGLTVVSLEDFSCPIVAVNLWYHVGSKDEDPNRQGFAHMFEHMMFRGTDRLGATDHFDLIRKTGGSCNAYTTFDQTVYTQTLPANQLNLAMWLEAERMSMLKIDQTAFDTERKVVEEERRMGINKPYGKLLEEVLPYVFPNHPYRWATIGSIPHLRSSSVPELREFWTKYYVPNNATLIVVGAATHAEVFQLAQRNFGWIPRGDDPSRIAAPQWTPYSPQDITLQLDNAPAPAVGLVFRGVPLKDDDATAIDLMTTILGGGDSSRLYRKIVAEDQSAVVAAAVAMNLEQDGVIGVAAVLSPLASDADQVIATLRDEIGRIQTEPVSDAELTKAKNQMMRSLVTESLTVDSKASALGSAAVLEGDVSRVNSRLARIRDVSAEDIQRVARKYLDLNHAIVGRIDRSPPGASGDDVENTPITGVPEQNPPPPGRPGIQRPADRIAKSPVADPLKFSSRAAYEQLTLDNGLDVIVVENHEVPFVSVQLGFEAGAWTDAHPGSATMALAMLTKGTTEHTEKELSEELESYAISLNGSAGMDSASLGMGCLPEQIDRGLRLMAEVVLHSTMPEDEFDKLKKQTRTSMEVSSKDPSYIASRELRRRIFRDHPYARSALGELSDLDALTRDEVRQWWEKYARPDAATLVFAGDIDLSEAGSLAKKYFISWQSTGPAPSLDAPPLPPLTDRQIFLVDNPGVQSEIRVGHLSFTRQDPAYFASRVVNGYFGGAFSSRLNESIRVEKGLTYGASGGFSASKLAGQFTVSTFSKNASTVEAVRAILDEVDQLRVDAPTDDELNETISYVIGSYPADRETPQQVASDIWFQRLMGLPENYFEQLLEGVSATTSPDCLQLAQQKVHPEHLILVVVGPADQLKEPLEQIAPVTVVTPEE